MACWSHPWWRGPSEDALEDSPQKHKRRLCAHPRRHRRMTAGVPADDLQDASASTGRARRPEKGGSPRRLRDSHLLQILIGRSKSTKYWPVRGTGASNGTPRGVTVGRESLRKSRPAETDALFCSGSKRCGILKGTSTPASRGRGTWAERPSRSASPAMRRNASRQSMLSATRSWSVGARDHSAGDAIREARCDPVRAP